MSRKVDGFPGGPVVKNLPVRQKTWVRFRGQEDPLKKGMATHSSIFAWRIPMAGGAWLATVHGVAKSRIQLTQLSRNTCRGISGVVLQREGSWEVGRGRGRARERAEIFPGPWKPLFHQF